MANLPPEAVASFQHQKEHINDDRRPGLLAVTWSLWVMDIVALSLRFYSKSLIRGGFRLEDVWILVAFVFLTGICIDTTVATFHGAARHLILSSPNDVIVQFQTFYVYAQFYTTAIAAIKLSVLSFYHRSFEPKRSFRIATWCMAGVVGCWWVATMGTCIWACKPISHFWNRNQPGGCYDQATGQLSTSIINVCTDFAIVLMPMPVVWKLHLPTARKISTSGIFLLGGIVILASIMRLPNLYKTNAYDFPYDSVPIGLWTTAELCIGILGASLPLMTPLLRRIIEISTKKSSKGDGSGSAWPRTGVSDGRRRNSKTGLKDEIPVETHDEWVSAVPQNDPRVQASHVSDKHATTSNTYHGREEGLS